MHFQYHVALPALPNLRDPLPIIRAIPGVQTVRPQSADPADEPAFAVEAVNQVGPIRLKMRGVARLQYPAPHQAVASVELRDAVAGTVYGTFRMTAGEGGLDLEADVTIGGRLGEFAQPLLRRKAEETVRGFGHNLQKWVAAGLPRDQDS